MLMEFDDDFELEEENGELYNFADSNTASTFEEGELRGGSFERPVQ